LIENHQPGVGGGSWPRVGCARTKSRPASRAGKIGDVTRLVCPLDRLSQTPPRARPRLTVPLADRCLLGSMPQRPPSWAGGAGQHTRFGNFTLRAGIPRAPGRHPERRSGPPLFNISREIEASEGSGASAFKAESNGCQTLMWWDAYAASSSRQRLTAAVSLSGVLKPNGSAPSTSRTRRRPAARVAMADGGGTSLSARCG